MTVGSDFLTDCSLHYNKTVTNNVLVDGLEKLFPSVFTNHLGNYQGPS